jgi:hypothetical protein
MIAPLILAGALAASAPQSARPDCALMVRFGSYAMGIDRPAAARIETFLAGRPEVTATQRRPWGREGEYDLCVRLKPKADAVALFEAMRSLVPAKPVGPIEVRMTDRAYGITR